MSESTPKIYSTFTAKDKDSDKIIEYRIQDIPKDKYEEAVNLYLEHFIKDEPCAEARKLYENKHAVIELTYLWREGIKSSRLGVACFKSDGEMVGVNILSITAKDDEHSIKASEKNLKDMVAVMDYTMEQANIYSKYNVDKYLSSLGLCVNRDYRGRGIAKELLKARAYILRDLGLTVTVTPFSATGSQYAAKCAGYEELFGISYEDLKKVSPDFEYKNVKSKSYKVMALQI
ncbi:hypothetical protein ACKWTF_014677 [Chironomus riparius]